MNYTTSSENCVKINLSCDMRSNAFDITYYKENAKWLFFPLMKSVIEGCSDLKHCTVYLLLRNFLKSNCCSVKRQCLTSRGQSKNITKVLRKLFKHSYLYWTAVFHRFYIATVSYSLRNRPHNHRSFDVAMKLSFLEDLFLMICRPYLTYKNGVTIADWQHFSNQLARPT